MSRIEKITKLTAAQEARLVEFREEWLQVGLSCEPADFETGDAVIRDFYKRIGKAEPIILHFSSPAMCELAVNVIFSALPNKALDSQLSGQLDSQLYSQLDSQLGSQLYSQLGSQLRGQLGGQLYSQLDSQLGSQLRGQLYSQLDSQLGSQLYSQLGSQLGGQLGGQLYSQLDSQLGSQLRGQLGGQLGSQLGSQLRGQLGSQILSQLYSQLDSQLDSQLGSQLYSQLDSLNRYFLTNRWGGNHWCYWESFYLFAAEIGVNYSPADIELLHQWARLAKSVGWWAPWNGICFVSDRPRRVEFADGLLHCETGKSVEYSDGWGVSSWQGVRVPDHWILDRENLDPAEVLAVENVEQRAAGAAIVGWPKMVAKLNRRIIDGDPDSDLGALIELTLPGLPEPGRFLQAKCPRNGTIVEGVPRISDIDGLPIETAVAAQAWRIGDPQSEYSHPPRRT